MDVALVRVVEVSEVPVRYRSGDEDSARWLGFPYRQGDIVISARSKSGTTWVQMICALLVFQNQNLPAPLAELSPWLDWLVTPRDEVYARLSAQRHRRFVKTPHSAGRDSPRSAGHLHRCGAASAGHGGVSVPPGRQPRP